VTPTLWWLDEDPLEPEWRNCLIGSENTDLCIIGGGYTGLWTALQAKEDNPNRRVIIVEARETGWGASGRNGGFCNTSLTHGFMNGFSRFPEEIETLERMGRENLDGIEETIKRYKIKCDWERNGEIKVATAPWQFEEMKIEAELRNQYGDNVTILDRDETQKYIKSPMFYGALVDHDGTAMIDPARLVWGLEKACLSLGVEIYENSKVIGISQYNGLIKVQTNYGEIYAQRVAVATNVHTELIRSSRKYVVPVYDYQIVTEPLSDEQLKSIGWENREGISDGGYQFHYYRLTKDNRILWGGYDAIYNFRGKISQDLEWRADTYANLVSDFLETFPQLEGIRFTHAWGGAIDTCTRFSPFWGTKFGGKVAYVAGFTGLGVAATRFGARVMLDLLDGVENERTQLKMVRKKPWPFPPEPFRYIFIQITKRSMQKADRNEGKPNLWLKLLTALGLGFDS
jgi:glycine/D-amino acid oxidase-like deaminating enzyme